MAITGKSKLAVEICDALGLKYVVSLDIHIAVNEIVTVTAKFYPEEYGMKMVPAILKKYELVEKKDESSLEEQLKVLDDSIEFGNKVKGILLDGIVQKLDDELMTVANNNNTAKCNKCGKDAAILIGEDDLSIFWCQECVEKENKKSSNLPSWDNEAY